VELRRRIIVEHKPLALYIQKMYTHQCSSGTEEKRKLTIELRDLDFIDAQLLFDGRPAVTAPANTPFESRFVSVAMLNDGKFYTVVWTWRADARRIISFRRARDREARAYREIFG
jgi:uncharacterized DUF497 family protein